MYAIAFFTTVILFSASHYIGHKFVYVATHFHENPAETDLHISHSTHIVTYRQSA